MKQDADLRIDGRRGAGRQAAENGPEVRGGRGKTIREIKEI